MAPDYKTYLATNVLNEGTVVTYRLLSHELKIHANLAKQMLYDFHSVQNAKKPGSVHATYLVSGLQEVVEDAEPPKLSQRDGEGDVPMPSSPYMSSSMPQEAHPAEVRRVLTLVREEGLERVKAKYKDVTSIHVYSLESVSPKDMQVLAQPNRLIASKFAKEDPLIYFKQYGVIQNPNVKRRKGPDEKGKGAPPPPPSAAPATVAKSVTPTTSQKPAAKAGSKPQGKPGLKKETSDLFKSFAKAKPKEVKKEDVPMRDVSDDEGEEEPREKPDMTSTKLKDQREDRAQKLRALMDDDDKPMSNAEDEEADEEEEAEPEPEPEPEAIDEPALEDAKPEKEDEEPQVTVSGGRRRGKRKVMKKITMKDEEGYLITKEEPVWEDFSEDEAPPPTQKSKPASSSGKAKSSSAKGQGNIMSFFGKK